ncbi:hypothetical protein E1B28_002278 [Marasmius oreades]|uniref:DUF6534 domain-containing protein n=1 Tax=Marasmius oreades TaxID=181124 RepID=A0A9P7UNT0_9AGAR|nr:uncharacterized protein E1B28_002278 [Marasmius oreades]KAG7086314.1 hypothetical protein E1B28_002278 [Marasmius oreades]
MVGFLDNSLGGLLGGTWANSYLFMVEIIMAFRYFSRFREDPLWLKFVVCMTLAVDLTSTINHYACAYMYTVIHWGDRDFLQNQNWTFPVYLVTTGASAVIVQQFLIYRFWTLTNGRIVTAYLALASLAAFGGAIATAVIVVQHSTFGERGAVRIPVTIWLIASAVADISIAATLIFVLQKYKTPFRKTQSLIKQLTTLAIQTGSPGSILAAIALIVYLKDPDGNISVGIGFTLGRVYAITLLNNLISREKIRRIGAQSANGFTDLHISGICNASVPGNASRNETGIHVRCTAEIHVDEERSSDTAALSPTVNENHEDREEVTKSRKSSQDDTQSCKKLDITSMV